MSPIAPVERMTRAEDGGEDDLDWGMLNFYRATLLNKCAGLSDEQLCSRAIPPSNLSLMGMLRHLADVEVYWFAYVFAGLEGNYAYDPDMLGDDFNNVTDSRGEDVASVFLDRVAQSNRLAVGVDLNTLSKRTDEGPINLRFIVVHMIEEYARHCGHADLLREVLDGETGH
jgi:uncharacterized damage-inducible protein DinB